MSGEGDDPVGLGQGVVDGQFDEVGVRVAHVDRLDWAERPGAGDWPLLDWDAGGLELGDGVRKCAREDEAQICAAGRRTIGLRLEVVIDLVQVDLGVPTARAMRPSPKVIFSRPRTLV